MTETPKLQPVRRQSVSDTIIEQLITLIETGELAPGQRLPSERDLSRQLEVGRASLREALRSLAVMGIVEGRVGEGTFVTRDSGRYLEQSVRWGLLLDEKGVNDLAETRVLLESQTAAFAAERASEEDLASIEATLPKLEAAVGNADGFIREDLQFHLAIASASQNRLLYHLLHLTRNHLQQWILRSLDDPATEAGQRRALLTLDEHWQICDAISSGDPDRASTEMRNHILSSSQGLTVMHDKAQAEAHV